MAFDVPFAPVPRDPAMAMLEQPERSWLLRALELGRNGWGRVHPNPLVGCVIVRDGECVGEGWHQEYGGPHAEVMALGKAGERARGATAYVSLEPCAHFGKTPPCTLALLEAGVSRVVFGAGDPGSDSRGGAEALAGAGVEVVGPCFTPEESFRENPSFFRWAQDRRPFVAVKLAMSLDARISAEPGKRSVLSGPEAAAWVHRLRSGFDGIMVGSETALVDDPLLTVREGASTIRPPSRIVLDTRARIPSTARIFRDRESAPVVVFVGDRAPEASMERLEAAGGSVHPVPQGPEGLDLAAVLEVCGELGIRSILCEGGGEVASALVRHDLAQRLFLLLSPVTLGPRGVPAFREGISASRWAEWEVGSHPSDLGRDVLVAFERRLS
jgi:diaminohydroxyphosphoribosylaminopyrimidine deaminase/5-amino-6-(5-phosphoribosylamino)uracil reductase